MLRLSREHGPTGSLARAVRDEGTGEETSMVTIGVDAHKRLHVATALD